MHRIRRQTRRRTGRIPQQGLEQPNKQMSGRNHKLLRMRESASWIATRTLFSVLSHLDVGHGGHVDGGHVDGGHAAATYLVIVRGGAFCGHRSWTDRRYSPPGRRRRRNPTSSVVLRSTVASPTWRYRTPTSVRARYMRCMSRLRDVRVSVRVHTSSVTSDHDHAFCFGAIRFGAIPYLAGHFFLSSVCARDDGH